MRDKSMTISPDRMMKNANERAAAAARLREEEVARARTKEKLRKLATSTVSDSQAFSEVDVDGNQRLDFEEFLAMQPGCIRDQYSVEQIKAWFDSADANGDGTLSVEEFFAWSLSNAVQSHGTVSLQLAFEQYDKDGGGYLDAFEFGKACTDLGFGAVAEDLFNSLDRDGSGHVSYRELISSLTTASGLDDEDKVLITAFVNTLANGRSSEDQEAVQARVDTSKWRIRASDAVGVRTELQRLLRESGGFVADLLRLFDQDESAVAGGPLRLLIDMGEFGVVMRDQFGFRGNSGVLVEIFESLDTDGT